MEIPDHLTYLLSNLYVGQKPTVRNEHGTMYWFKIGKGTHRGCILSPCLFNFYAEYTCEIWVWIKHKLDSRVPGEIATISDMQMIPH